MKALNLLVLALVFAGTARAQQPAPSTANPPAITIIQISSHKQVFVPALYEDPMQVNQDQYELLRDQRAVATENAERARRGQPPKEMPAKKIANTPVGSTPMGTPIGDAPVQNRNTPTVGDPGPSSVHYVYEAKIKNTGDKAIRVVFWSYVVVDKETQAVVGHHRFRSNVTVSSGKTANLIGRSKNPPASVVSASQKPQRDETRYAPTVVIDRVEYSDNTFWELPQPVNPPEEQH